MQRSGKDRYQILVGRQRYLVGKPDTPSRMEGGRVNLLEVATEARTGQDR